MNFFLCSESVRKSPYRTSRYIYIYTIFFLGGWGRGLSWIFQEQWLWIVSLCDVKMLNIKGKAAIVTKCRSKLYSDQSKVIVSIFHKYTFTEETKEGEFKRIKCHTSFKEISFARLVQEACLE